MSEPANDTARRPLDFRVLALLAMLTSACIDAGVAPAPSASTEAAPPDVDIAVLPNNTTVHAGRAKLVALRGDGEIAWELPLPDGDSIIAPVAVGLNSMAYVRGTKALHAALPDGKWAWSRPLEARSYSKTRSTDAPVTMSDSTVALVVADDVVRFDHSGNVRWRISLPEGHVTSTLVAGMDGSLIAATSAGLFSINPEGRVTWRRVLAR